MGWDPILDAISDGTCHLQCADVDSVLGNCDVDASKRVMCQLGKHVFSFHVEDYQSLSTCVGEQGTHEDDTCTAGDVTVEPSDMAYRALQSNNCWG